MRLEILLHTRTTAIIVIPIVSFLMVFMFARNKNSQGIRDAIIKSHILLFAFVAFSTEILSLFGWLDYPRILGIWIAVCFSLFLCFTRHKEFDFPHKASLCHEMRQYVPELTVIAFFLIATLLTGLLYPPNNWDSMTYHMSRVAHWVNHGDLLFYPTHIERQLYQMPLAEFAILHGQILSGSDAFANAVQWVCFAASICLVSLIARELGLSRVSQLLSSVMFTTIPMAVLQASSTQNDLVVTSFILSFALFMLRMRKDFNRSNAMFASLSLGLALLTKGTAWVYCPALGLFLALPILHSAWSDPPLLTKRVGLLSLVVMLALVINSGHFLRNCELYGKPIASGSENYFCQDLSAPAVIGNILRNVSLHLGTPSSLVNCYLYRTMQNVLGKQLNNPDNTWPGTSFGITFSRHEDSAGNLIHMLFIIIAFGSAFIWMRRQRFLTNFYVTGVFFAGFLYCVLLKWQPWASRLHTPVFALSCVIIVIAAQRWSCNIRRYATTPLIILMFAISLPFAVNNQSRSLKSLEWSSKSRAELYFANRPQLYESYKNVVELVNMSGVKEVGLFLGGDDWEYPFWALGGKSISYLHVGVDNTSRHARSKAAMPAYVIATKDINISLQRLNDYHIAYSDQNVHLLIRNTAMSPS